MQKYAKLSSFGLFDKLVIGANTKKIVVRKYNIKSRKQLKVYIKEVIK